MFPSKAHDVTGDVWNLKLIPCKIMLAGFCIFMYYLYILAMYSLYIEDRLKRLLLYVLVRFWRYLMTERLVKFQNSCIPIFHSKKKKKLLLLNVIQCHLR